METKKDPQGKEKVLFDSSFEQYLKEIKKTNFRKRRQKRMKENVQKFTIKKN